MGGQWWTTHTAAGMHHNLRYPMQEKACEKPPLWQLSTWQPCAQDTVNFPVHLKNFNMGQLRQLCKELRSDIVHTVSKTGGELGCPVIQTGRSLYL